jgi:beta-glucosidase
MKTIPKLILSLIAGLGLTALVGCDTSSKSTPVEQKAAVPSEAASESVEWPAINSRVKRDPAVEARVEELLARLTL